jgi:hypothetical protein
MGWPSALKLPNTHLVPPVLQVVGKIIYLQQNYHFGSQKIAMYLARYQRQLPGHQIQIDVKFVDAIQGSGRGKKFYQFTAISFYDYTASRMPFKIERVQTDNGSEFQSAFHLHLLDQGVEHRYIRPATPRLNGKVERSHRIDGRGLTGQTPYERWKEKTNSTNPDTVVEDVRQLHTNLEPL